ncbi:hypothetical protein L9F63_018803 [Diploptera punctata]|uniref:Uncharacterized protein n=1 Tax=Diploptera punctata TaxID=6984 RepID=A0AAD7ZX48_DIPPU|nr:hypothetical protein L9F63_018803 [Diploptera punctata]
MSETNVSTVGSASNLVPVSSRKSRLKKRTRLEIILMIVVVILVILLIFFFILTIILACMNDKNESVMEAGKRAGCNSEQCIKSAFSLLDSMDQQVDPCEDFYQFACGNWGKNHPVQELQIANNWFAEVQESLLRDLKELLTDSSDNSSEPNAVYQAKSLYRSCVNTDRLEEVGLEPIITVLDNRVLGLDSLVQLGPDIDTDTGEFIINFSPPKETPQLIKSLVTDPEDLPRATRLSGQEAVRARLQYMAGILQLIQSWGKSEEEAAASNVTSVVAAAVKIMLFSAKVTLGITDEETNGTVTKTKMTIPAFQDLMDSSTRGAPYSNKINFEKYMKVLLEGIDKPFDLATYQVSIRDIHYFQTLAWTLANSHIQTIQRYVWWQVVELLSPHTNKAMRFLKNQLTEKYFGTLQRTSRSSLCVRRVQNLLPKAVSYAMAKQQHSDSTVNKVEEMLNDIRESFNGLVSEEDWINQETKKAAQEKADAVTSFIGYQDWLLKPGKLDEYYDKLSLDEENYLSSVLKLKHREVVGFLNEILSGQTINNKSDTWDDIDPLQVNAFYVRQENSILIPAGILHFPFYGRGLEALNYGSIGSILGHELTHGFDSEGKDYGKEGTKVSWWNAEMLQAYEDRAQCFIKQYCEFGPNKYKVNGKQTLAENIADNGGIREAYRAYQKYKERHVPEPYLPGLENFTHEQLLFLAFANLWCTAEGPEYEEYSVKDTHSPARYRVLGSLSNSPEFSETWKCAVNKTMNPTSRCIIW